MELNLFRGSLFFILSQFRLFTLPWGEEIACCVCAFAYDVHLGRYLGGFTASTEKGVQVPWGGGWRCAFLCNVSSGCGNSLRLLVLVLFVFVLFFECIGRSWDVSRIPSFVFCVRRLWNWRGGDVRCRAGWMWSVDGRVGGWSRHHTNMQEHHLSRERGVVSWYRLFMVLGGSSPPLLSIRLP